MSQQNLRRHAIVADPQIEVSALCEVLESVRDV